MLAGMNPVWEVRTAITQMMTLLRAARAQPYQLRRPTRMVETTVSTHEM